MVKLHAGEPRQAPRWSRATTRQWKTSPVEASEAGYVRLRLTGGREGKLPDRVAQEPQVVGRERQLVVGPARDDEPVGGAGERGGRRETTGRGRAPAVQPNPLRAGAFVREEPGVGEDVVETFGHGPVAAAVDEETLARRVVGDRRPEARGGPVTGGREPLPRRRRAGGARHEHVRVVERFVVGGPAAEEDEAARARVVGEPGVAARRREITAGVEGQPPGRLRRRSRPSRAQRSPRTGPDSDDAPPNTKRRPPEGSSAAAWPKRAAGPETASRVQVGVPPSPFAPSSTQVSPDGVSQLPAHPPNTIRRLPAGS